MPVRARLVPSRHAVAFAGAAGIVVVVLGTFLPWLRSGRSTRNSYETTGTVRRLVAPQGVVNDLFRVWPLLAAACAVAIAAYLVGLRTVGAVLAVGVALAAGCAAIAALRAPASAYASVIDTGPAITLGGAVVVLVSAVSHLATIGWIRVNGRTSNDAAAE